MLEKIKTKFNRSLNIGYVLNISNFRTPGPKKEIKIKKKLVKSLAQSQTDVYKRQVLTSSNDFGPQTCNKSNRKWKSSMSFGDTTYMRVMVLSPPRLLFFHFFRESSHT